MIKKTSNISKKKNDFPKVSWWLYSLRKIFLFVYVKIINK